MNVDDKREREKKIVSQMIALYCHHQHQTNTELCKQCNELKEYAIARSDACPFMEQKTFCSNCKVHCYNPEKRQQIKAVMRYAGPRMIFYHPIIAMRHVVETRRERKTLK